MSQILTTSRPADTKRVRCLLKIRWFYDTWNGKCSTYRMFHLKWACAIDTVVVDVEPRLWLIYAGKWIQFEGRVILFWRIECTQWWQAQHDRGYSVEIVGESAFMLDYRRYNAFPFRICALIFFRAIYRYAFVFVYVCHFVSFDVIVHRACEYSGNVAISLVCSWNLQLTEAYSYGFPFFKSNRRGFQVHRLDKTEKISLILVPWRRYSCCSRRKKGKNSSSLDKLLSINFSTFECDCEHSVSIAGKATKKDFRKTNDFLQFGQREKPQTVIIFSLCGWFLKLLGVFVLLFVLIFMLLLAYTQKMITTAIPHTAQSNCKQSVWRLMITLRRAILQSQSQPFVFIIVYFFVFRILLFSRENRKTNNATNYPKMGMIILYGRFPSGNDHHHLFLYLYFIQIILFVCVNLWYAIAVGV